MPELPEVETSCRGIAPYIENKRVNNLVIRNAKLRWPVSSCMPGWVKKQRLVQVKRRAKYLLLHFEKGHLVIHLGMSGSLRILTSAQPAGKHDHIDLCFEQGYVLRYNDPRRFGFWLWHSQPETKKLFSQLGPEPLSQDFNVNYLYKASRGRKTAIKNLIMDNKVVVGVGNIYAAESLFRAGINPKRKAGDISLQRYKLLVSEIKQVLDEAIAQGGTSLKDFTRSDGKPGYFKQQLRVYGREGEPCVVCLSPLKSIRQGQRATVYCVKCQT